MQFSYMPLWVTAGVQLSYFSEVGDDEQDGVNGRIKIKPTDLEPDLMCMKVIDQLKVGIDEARANSYWWIDEQHCG